KNRPLPAGRMLPSEAISFAAILGIASITIMGLAINLVAAGLLALTIAFYVIIYTVWLKPRTPQNIVIGGAAGAFPPMIGWAAVTGSVDLVSISLFLIIFFWTPPHFWALALVRSDDYARANIPMLPNVAGNLATRKQILLYSVILQPITVLPYILGAVSIGYAIWVGITGFLFVGGAFALYHQYKERRAMYLFTYSIFYLFSLFVAMIGFVV
ncbi:MAG: heme o synthase, partial [Pseudomonadota bacterium]